MTGPFSEWRKRLVPAPDLTRHPLSSIRSQDQENFIFVGPILVERTEHSAENELIVSACLEDIDRADMVFAHINIMDIPGVTYELGYAAKKGTPIFISFTQEDLRRHFWFAKEGPNTKSCICPETSVKRALDTAIRTFHENHDGQEQVAAREPVNQPPNMDRADASDLERAMRVGGELLDILPNLPPPAEEFAESVEVKAESILATIERMGRVTPNQLRALENMYEGAKKWLR
jgi:hypothetical protein